MKNRRLSARATLSLMIIFYLIALIVAFCVGRYGISPIMLLKVTFSKILPIKRSWPLSIEKIIFNIRLPRIIAASLIGSSLSVAGLVYQNVFRNPLVSPDVLGTTNASAFGAALAMLVGLPLALVTPISLIFGLLSILLVYTVASKVPNNHVLGLVLGGIMLSSIFSSLTSLVKLVADPVNTLPAITYFLMGSVAGITNKDLTILFPFILLGLIPLILLAWRINLLSLAEDEARSLGVNTKSLRFVVITASAIMIAATVAVSGVIGWVGLVIPHIVRMLIGPDCRKAIPAAIFTGGGFLVLIDTIARTATTSEIPLGILTALIGAPFFLYLILREGKKDNA